MGGESAVAREVARVAWDIVNPAACTHTVTISASPPVRPTVRVPLNFNSNPVIKCTLCGCEWVCLDVRSYVSDDRKKEVDAIIADALRDGRNDIAIGLYVETHWDEVKALFLRSQGANALTPAYEAQLRGNPP